ncbi:hypothetical protein [Caminicella sporogenes]|uniref:hypothetical protein n=1 Tax=Caminicella sporogenes TaxID=166485 RepID=UPI00253FFA0A|nr:hypothetical protein [Caminicella sporogenes]WIF94649.1 hypothetical protein QNI18_10340 [Caminicella sporogenes]
MKIILFKIVFSSVLIILLAYITTLLISVKYKSINSNKNIKIIERLTLGVDKQFLLIKLFQNYYLIYISKNGAQVIDKIDSINSNEKDVDCKDKHSNLMDILLKKITTS